MKRWQKVLLVIAAILVVAGAALQAFRVSLGKINVPKFEKIAEGTYAYSDGMNQSNIYLVLGDERAALIDTGNGLSDLPAGIEEITDLPVIVINTHGHYDHIHGNYFFDTVYMPATDDEVFQRHITVEEIERQMQNVSPFIRWFMKYQTETIESVPVKTDYTPLPDEGYIDLGNRKLEFIELPGHTPGSTAYLDRATGELFCGDAITSSGVLLNLQESLPISTYIETLDYLQSLVDEGTVKSMYSGHGAFVMETDIIQSMRSGCEDILDGNISDEELEDHAYSVDGRFIKWSDETLK